MLRAALNIRWQDHSLILNYMEISQRLQLENIGCVSWDIVGEAEMISKVLLWEPPYGKRTSGRPLELQVLCSL